MGESRFIRLRGARQLLRPCDMSTRSVVVAAGLVLMSIAACGPRPKDPAGDDGGPDVVGMLEVRISSPQVRWKDGVTSPATLQAILTVDGVETDVTDRASFSITPVALGSVTGTDLALTGNAAGPAMLIGTIDGYADEAPFEVFVEKTLPGTGPSNADTLFGGAMLNPSAQIEIVYPPAAALVPPNLGEMEVHYSDPFENNTYEIQASGGYVTLTTYLDRAGAIVYPKFTADEWKLLASGKQGVDLTIRVRSLDSNAPSLYIEGTRQLKIAAEDLRGGVYYWNTTQAAILRYDMTTPTVPPERFYPPPGQTGCVGCHAVSRDGSVVAFRREGGNLNYGNAVDVQSLTTKMDDAAQRWSFVAVHPNNVDMFTTMEDGLHLTDLTTGANRPLYQASRISHPDVSPDGKSLVAVEVQSGQEVWITGSRLVSFDYDPTTKVLGSPRTLVEPDAAGYPYYPSFSPDNKWVVFNKAPGANSVDNPSAELWVTRADGTMTPLRLIQAEAGTHNSWPKFTPFVSMEPTASGGSETVLWFTTASRRPFGLRALSPQPPQLWLAPFYPDRLAAGLPATGPAVRLPFQPLDQGNHIAQWTEEIVTIQ